MDVPLMELSDIGLNLPPLPGENSGRRADQRSYGSAPELAMTFRVFETSVGRSLPNARQAYRDLFAGDQPETVLPIAKVIGDANGTVKLILTAALKSHRSTGEMQPLEIESVIIPMRNYHGQCWNTLCISSQIGCRMGCDFCQTGQMGLLGQLSASQIVAQVVVAKRWLGQHTAGAEIKNIVFMGMGEPLDNADAVFAALRVLMEPRGLGFSASRITLSTVGRVDGLRRLAGENLPGIRLAISLTSADDALRSRLMPINRAMPLAELKACLKALPRSSRARYLIQCVLLGGVNDRAEDAARLADWCDGLPVIVNVIPYNPQQPPLFKAPAATAIVGFMEVLKARGILVKRRATIGQSLMGACGQLGNSAIARTGSERGATPPGAAAIR